MIYADISLLSDYPGEGEVLLDLNASFQLGSIEREGPIEVVNVTVLTEGEKMTREYIQRLEKESQERSVVIVLGSLMCNLGEYGKSQKYFENLLSEPNGEDTAWIEFCIGQALDYKNEWERARSYYELAYERMMTAIPARIKHSSQIINNIVGILYRQGRYGGALEFHQRPLRIRQDFYPSEHVDIAARLNNIGHTLVYLETYMEALDYCQQALEMREKCYPTGHIDTAKA